MSNELISIERLTDYNDNMLRDANVLKRSTAYILNQVVCKGQVVLKCSQAGTTDSTTLSLSGVAVDDELTDGTAKWNVISITGYGIGEGTGAGLEDWESNHNYAVDDIYVYEGEIYKTLIAFTSGATEDSRTKVNNIIPSVWTANTAYTAGDIIEHTDVTTLKKVYYNVTANFTSSATFEVTAEMQELQIVEEYVPNPLTKQQVKNLIRNFVPSGSGTDPIFYNDSPIGTIIAYMGITAPKDYLACDGTVYNIADYKELAEYIKVQFGTYNYFGGNGTTTFAVPDLRGEFLRGTGTNSHTNNGNGANVGQHQDGTQIPAYGASGTALTVDNAPPDGSSNINIQQSDYSFKRNASGTGRNVGFTGSWSSSNNNMFVVRPTNTSVLYCIKYNTSILSTPENNYSTEEQRIGTWIDGKPLYQKTYSGTIPSGADSENTDIIIDNTIGNIENGFIVDGYITDEYNSHLQLNQGTDGDTVFTLVWLSISQMSIRGRVSTSLVSCPIVVTIKYTKTTD